MFFNFLLRCMKKSKISPILAVLLALSFFGCGWQKRMTMVMTSWTGHPVNEVIGVWGPPNTVYDNHDGTRSYVWNTTTQYPSRTQGKYIYPGATFTHYWLFVVNTEGKIIGWRFGTQ